MQRAHTVIMHFQAFYHILNVFLLAPWLFIEFCTVLPCPRPRLKWQPSPPREGRTKKAVYHLSSAPRYAYKQTWFTSESPLSLQAPTSIPSSLPHLTSLHSEDVLIINLVASVFLTMLSFWYSNRFVHRVSSKQKTGSSLVTKCSIPHSFSRAPI